MGGRQTWRGSLSIATLAIAACSAEDTSARGRSQFPLMEARVEAIEVGEPIDAHPTLWITVDKGRRDGVPSTIEGFVRVHPAANYLFRVREVRNDSTVLHGWFHEDIGVGTRVVLNVGRVSDDAVGRYFDRNP